MRIPQFINVEFNDSGDRLFPTALAWSLDDGQIKSVLVIPDDDWLDHDDEAFGVDLDYLREQGVPLGMILEELNEDLGGTTVYTDGLDPDEALVETLYETLGRSPGFEVAMVTDLLTGWDPDDFNDRLRDRMAEEGLDPDVCESTVVTLLLIARDEGLIDL